MNSFFFDSLARAAKLKDVGPMQRIKINVDLALAHDGTAAAVIDEWEKSRYKTIFDPSKVVLTIDHTFPAPDIASRSLHKKIEKFAGYTGIKCFNRGEGVLHQVIAERFNLSPGMCIVGADGHVGTAGAFGALAFSCSGRELAVVLAEGKYQLTVPQVTTVFLKGISSSDITARDVAMYLFQIAQGKLKGKAVVLAGDWVENLIVSERMALCNMVSEAGVRTVYIAAGDVSEKNAEYIVDVSILKPMIASPPSPEQVGLAGELAGLPINVAIIGGCSSGRLEDFKNVAETLANHEVHPQVTFLLTPASRQVACEMDKTGLSKELRNKGAVILPPGCGPCPGKHQGILAPGDRAIAATVRNTPGRMGSREAEIFLASTITVTKAAIAGKIA